MRVCCVIVRRSARRETSDVDVGLALIIPMYVWTAWKASAISWVAPIAWRRAKPWSVSDGVKPSNSWMPIPSRVSSRGQNSKPGFTQRELQVRIAELRRLVGVIEIESGSIQANCRSQTGCGDIPQSASHYDELY